MEKKKQQLIVKILVGMSIVLGIIVIYKSGFKTGQWLYKKTNDTATVKK